MKNLFLRPTTLMAGCAMLMFTACNDDSVEPQDMPLSAQSAQEAHRSNSLNLDKTYTADIMSLNNSGVTGTATLMLEGNMLTVHIMASGLEPGMVHPQHIHGFTESNKNATCPPMSADMDGDGLVELGEGLPFYGPVMLPLDPFPTAPDGTVDYTRTFDISDMVGLLPLQNDVIVLHGMTVDGEYIATLPVACAAIKPMNNGKSMK